MIGSRLGLYVYHKVNVIIYSTEVCAAVRLKGLLWHVDK